MARRRKQLFSEPQVQYPDFERMTAPQLIAYGRHSYQQLQQLFQTELNLPQPDWKILESVAHQLTMLEEGYAALGVKL